MILKDRYLLSAWLGSLTVHLLGFFLVRVHDVEAIAPRDLIEVNLVESLWTERLLELPGESREDQWIFETPDDSLWSRDAAAMPVRRKTVYPELAKSEPARDEIIEVGQPDRRVQSSSPAGPNREVSGNPRDVHIEGPVSARTVLFRKLPEYPFWAQEFGLEFEVRLRFWVLPGGDVGGVVVENSSGYPEIDAGVVRDMKLWKFGPVRSGLAEAQWGKILFKFRLRR